MDLDWNGYRYKYEYGYATYTYKINHTDEDWVLLHAFEDIHLVVDAAAVDLVEYLSNGYVMCMVNGVWWAIYATHTCTYLCQHEGVEDHCHVHGGVLRHSEVRGACMYMCMDIL